MPGLSLVRPLLGLRRSQLADVCTSQGLRWVDDPTNDKPLYVRNLLRQHLEVCLRLVSVQASSGCEHTDSSLCRPTFSTMGPQQLGRPSRQTSTGSWEPVLLERTCCRLKQRSCCDLLDLADLHHCMTSIVHPPST